MNFGYLRSIFQKRDSEKGISLLLAVILIAAALASVIGITSSFITLLQISGRVQESAAAFYAADSGVEWQLYQVRNGPVNAPSFLNGATYNVTYASGTPSIIKSIGIYKNTSRGIEAEF